MSIFNNVKDSKITARAALMVGTLGIVGLIGFSAVSAQTTDASGSGYGSGPSSVVDTNAANTFETATATYTNTFTSEVAALQTQAESQLKAGSGDTDFTNFDTSYDSASTTYASLVSQAFDTFRSQVADYANTATSKDQFIDEFNNAKATYLNSLDAAKNQLADSLSQLSGNGNVVKDQFIDGFNSDRDAYSNNLEQAKNDFAAILG